ncbi:Ltp family lipoprotein [Levilactobacillus yonginensis]|uniref:Ltp family lipoprotein n=1 Tax=Levilactobacillus yonginensis TaxID=1054041 RepID=UPI00345DE48C
MLIQQRTADSSSSETSETTETVSSTSKKKNSVPAEYEAALSKAESYADSMDMSKEGIYEQLTSDAGEQFSDKAATYAMNHLTDVDWNANALAKAKSYQKDMHMSSSAIRDQLTSSSGEQFTDAQADYAVSHLN